MNSENEKLQVIQGIVPSLMNLPRTGCQIFSTYSMDIRRSMHEENPTMHEVSPGHLVRCTCWQHFHFESEEGGIAR